MQLFGTDTNTNGEVGYGAFAKPGHLQLAANFLPMGREYGQELAILIGEAIEAALADGQRRSVPTGGVECVVIGVDETSIIVLGSHSGGCLDENEGPQGNMSRKEAIQMVATIRGQLA